MSFFAFLIYTFIYFIGLGTLLSVLLGVSPFVTFSLDTKEIFLNPFSDWLFLMNEFRWGHWSVDSGQNFVIFLSFILFFPGWIILWFLVRKIRLLKILFTPFYHFKRKKLEKIGSLDTSSSQKTTLMNRPKAMPKSMSFGNAQMQQVQEAQSSSNTQSASQAASSQNPTIPPRPAEQDTFTPQQRDFVEQLGKDYGMEMFERILLNDFIVPFVLATDSRAFLIRPLTQQTEWIADESITEGYDKPTWFSTQGLITSPVFELNQAAAALQEKEPDSELISVVVLTAGSVMNAALMQKTWAQTKAFVVRLDGTVDAADCITLAELLERDSFSYEEMEQLESAEDEQSDSEDVVSQEDDSSEQDLPADDLEEDSPVTEENTEDLGSSEEDVLETKQ